MIRPAVTISLVPEAQGGPFVYWDGLATGCARAAELGFAGVEIFPPTPEVVDHDHLTFLLKKFGLNLAAVGTGAGWVVQKLRLTDPDEAIRTRARAFIAGVIDFGAQFGAPAIIGSMQGRSEGNVTREQALIWLREALEELGAHAERRGVPLLIEPLNRYETNLLNTVADAVTQLDRLQTKNVRLLCDLFHMNIEETSIADALRTAGARVGHVHFADSNRRAVGFGHTDMEPVVRALRDIGYAGYVSAEILPLPDADAAATQTIMAYRQLFTSH